MPGHGGGFAPGELATVGFGSSVRCKLRTMDDEVLHGGVANAGAVIRRGPHVLRPSNHHSESIHRMLNALHGVGFKQVPEPVGIDPDGRERLGYIKGEVPIPPFPAWAQTDEALASVAVLIRGLHDASTQIDLASETWSGEMADPRGGPVLCHNDVCLENVVFRDERAVALLDFDFAAPGRRVFDIASFARMCVPIDDDVNAARLGWSLADLPSRLRLVVDAYGLDASDRNEVLALLDHAIENGGGFVRRRVQAGEPGFIQMWE
ncbi:MAG TPA: aminoglycoside phosphotransferase family protein, partial [Acidobacteria bacterium]|nr:aminoglycoside phosphotransferase family protein [Acidobacteriota bacterium]